MSRAEKASRGPQGEPRVREKYRDATLIQVRGEFGSRALDVRSAHLVPQRTHGPLFFVLLWLRVRAAATIPPSERLATNSGPHPQSANQRGSSRPTYPHSMNAPATPWWRSSSRSLFEKAGTTPEAVRWFTTAYERFRRPQWKQKAEEGLVRLGAPIPMAPAVVTRHHPSAKPLPNP